MDFEKALNFYHLHVKYCKERKKLCGDARAPNFPECLSESIVAEIIRKVEKVDCKKGRVGDLIKNKITRIEVKCFTSIGPSSFGPKEKWKEIYFLDATKFMKNEFKLFRVRMSNVDFENIVLNLNGATYKQQCDKGRRPRISFEKLLPQIKSKTKLIFSGSLEEIESIN